MATGSLSPYFKPRPLGPVPQDQPGTRPPGPLLMQRPQSSGVDMASFSFAKPAANQKSFSLRPAPKQGLINLNSTWAAGTVEDQRKDTGHDEQLRVPETCPPRSHTAPDAHSLGGSCQDRTTHRKQHDSSLSTESSNGKQLNAMDKPVSLQENQSSSLAHRAEARVDTILPADSGTDIEFEVIASRASSAPSAHDQQIINAGPPIRLASGRPIHRSNVSRVSKQRRQSRQSFSPARQDSFREKTGFREPTEEKLFKLLIGKIRQREEQDVANAELRCQLEEQNIRLGEENKELKQKLETCYERFQKTVSESKEYRSQVDHWKEKLRRFKQVVNDLGMEYDTLRDEANRFKVTTESLEKEKADLLNAIDDIRIQISRAEDTINAQKTKISQSEALVSVLRQSLKASEEMTESSRAELANEKNRSGILESYIQNYARNQTRQLLLIREDQRKLIKSVDSGIQSLSEESTISKDTLVSEFRTCADQLGNSIETLSEKCAADRMEVQDFTNTVHDAVSRFGDISTRFAAGVDASTTANASVSDKVQENLQLIERHLGVESTLLKQLGNCESSYGSLEERLAAIEPTLNTLDTSVKYLTTTESSLLGSLAGFCEKLAEAQIKPVNPGLEQELSKKFAENTQLQLQLQAVSLEVGSVRQRLCETEAQTSTLNQSLTKAIAERQKVEDYSHRIESEKLSMQEEFARAEQNIRQELDKEKSIATGQVRHEYEQKLQIIQKEKSDLETGSEEVFVQLGDVRDSLIEAKRMVDDQRREREALAEETEQQIQELTASYSEAMTRLDSQATQIQQYQEVETASTIEKSDLREQLKQMQENNQKLERALAVTGGTADRQEPSASNIVPFATFGNMMSPERDPSPYDDPADFAMLFITDESAAPSPAAKNNEPFPRNTKVVAAKQDLLPPVKDDQGIFDIPENTDQPRFTRKRKAVNFEAVPPRNNSKSTAGPHSGSMQAPEGLEDRPNKPSKHVHKFTYSRVHTTSTQIQREQSTAPARPAITERRTSPKSLVSASSENHPAGKPNTRSCGRRRSRGERYDARFSQEG